MPPPRIQPRHRRLAALVAASFCVGTFAGMVLLRIFDRLQQRRRAKKTRLPCRHGRRRYIVGVVGSNTSEESHLAGPLGTWIAQNGCHLLTGGGPAASSAVSKAFSEERRASGCGEGGLSLAVLPGLPAAHASDWARARGSVTSKLLVDQSSGVLQYSVVLEGGLNPEEAIVPPEGFPNPHVDVALQTHLPSSGQAGEATLSRNHICVLSSDVVVALPGGTGTASVIALAMRYGVPVCRYLGPRGRVESLSEAVMSSPVCNTLLELEEFVRDALERKPTERAPHAMRRCARAGSIDDLAVVTSSHSCPSHSCPPSNFRSNSM